MNITGITLQASYVRCYSRVTFDVRGEAGASDVDCISAM